MGERGGHRRCFFNRARRHCARVSPAASARPTLPPPVSHSHASLLRDEDACIDSHAPLPTSLTCSSSPTSVLSSACSAAALGGGGAAMGSTADVAMVASL